MPKKKGKSKIRPAQSLRKSEKGKEQKLKPAAVSETEKKYLRLQDKVAIITGADSGIGRAVALSFAKEGATLVLTYHSDYKNTKSIISRLRELKANFIFLKGDISTESFSQSIVSRAINRFGKIDIIVNNAGIHFPQKKLSKITATQLKRTFRVNVYGQLYLVKAAESHLRKGASIIHTTSVTAYRGSDHLIDYAASKGAIVSLLRSLSAYFVSMGIRVNGVAPGPVWTPLIASSFKPDEVATFGSDSPMKRAAEPLELAGAYVYLASEEASFVTGQVIHVNGGEILNT